MFAVLLLPMTLSLFASASQDATLISCACLAFGMISRQADAGASLSVCESLVVTASISGHGTRTATLRPTGIGTFHSGVVVPRAEDTLLDHRSGTERISCNGHSSLVGGST